MKDKITEAIKYYLIKREEISNLVNGRTNLTPDEIIDYGKQMEIIEYKITALEVAIEN